MGDGGLCPAAPLSMLPATRPHLAIRSEFKLQELMPVFACVAYIVSKVELIVCHGLAAGAAEQPPALVVIARFFCCHKGP